MLPPASAAKVLPFAHPLLLFSCTSMRLSAALTAAAFASIGRHDLLALWTISWKQSSPVRAVDVLVPPRALPGGAEHRAPSRCAQLHAPPPP